MNAGPILAIVFLLFIVIAVLLFIAGVLIGIDRTTDQIRDLLKRKDSC